MEIAKAYRAMTLLDTTFATPVNLRPLEYGIDLVMHSATKYLSGHNDLFGRRHPLVAPARINGLKDARGHFRQCD